MNKKEFCNKARFLCAAILMMSIVVAMVLSCSSDTPQLCRITLSLEGESSRWLSATIDPLRNYSVYYRTIYKGSDPQQAYGHMSNPSSYNKLTNAGILVSQGLWEVQAIFRENGDAKTYTPSKTDLVATSGDIYINLNTSSITVSFSSRKGNVNLSSYELRNLPSGVTNPSITVSAYKYDDSLTQFSTTATAIPVEPAGTNNTFSAVDSIQLDSGVYYAVVTVKGNVSGTTKTLFSDCIGFVVRSGLTTNLSGYCDKYDGSSSSGGSFIVKNNPTEEEKKDLSDIKEFAGNQFSSNGTYVITGGQYELIPKTNDTFNKELTSGQDVSINMNGNSIVNSDENKKTSFTIGSGANLTIFNDDGKNSTKAETFGYGDAYSKADKEPNFIVDGGTLTIGSPDTSVKGSIDLKGGPCGLDSSGTKHAAIVLTSYGGNVNLVSPGNGSYVNVEETTIGISTAFNETDKNKGDNMSISINMENASIHVGGDPNDFSTGIRLDGTKSGDTYYKGKIDIDIKGVGSDGDSIRTSNDNGSKVNIEQSCIYIFNYAGAISIKFDEKAKLLSKYGYAVALVNCTGDVRIENKGSALGSITYENKRSEKKGNAIYLSNCSNVTIYNSGTLCSDESSYEVYSAGSTVTVDKTNGGKDVKIYKANKPLTWKE